ncbi:BrnT family toxin [Magnetospirillum sp. SS-4]|uniref:BrnT family toxin n=1 Tax=Magnetospirillum sp. SS-4 TaxID=2681465 RepID=UPI00137C620F
MFEWDEAKSEANLRNRGFDFAYASLVFDGPILEMDDDREDYGEKRVQVIGQVDDDILFVVFTWRGDTRRIISARLANRRERDVYRQAFG